MKRLLPLVAALLLVVAALGLSSLRPNDYCGLRYTSETNVADMRGDWVAWPPGKRCIYEWADGRTEMLVRGNGASFLIMLAGGALAVWRRTRYAWASLIVLAVAGAAVLYAPEFTAVLAGFIFGLPLAWLATRSLFAGATAGALLFLGAVAFLADGGTFGWAVLLALVAVGEKVLDPLEKRLVDAFVGPRPELE